MTSSPREKTADCQKPLETKSSEFRYKDTLSKQDIGHQPTSPVLEQNE